MNIRWSVFPKFYQHLRLPELASLVREVGLDTTNLVIRDGYLVSRKTLDRDLPVFMKVMREAGLEVRFATAGFSPEEVLYGSTLAGVSTRDYLAALKDAGVGSLPGTSAEVLVDDIRRQISPGRIGTKKISASYSRDAALRRARRRHPRDSARP